MSRVRAHGCIAVAVFAVAMVLSAGAPAAASRGEASRVDSTPEADWEPNGCTSPAGNEPARLILDTHASFLDACNAHDRCYRDHTLGRVGCDWRFYQDMNESCARATNGNRLHAEYCYLWAGIYWVGVRGFGEVFYNARTDPRIFLHQWPRPGT